MNGLPLSIWRGFGEFSTLNFSKFTEEKERACRRHCALARLHDTQLPKLLSGELSVASFKEEAQA
ncbi:MAG: hypothetical protein OZ916_02445 [Nitrosomonas sp.]|uniref:hypothetical protein n=1 Tax=Nitrosomonas sp. TaxID=42353 RepID=UPI002B3EDA0E|nr:hypothetical protein [Nitrosomonas sp.]MEB2331132.1 hypothetical protein [Nitrosomonas sp.]HRQ05810.1 hypothetical protein [Nitrosomonas halophila]